MTDFAAAASLVDRLSAWASKGEMIGLVLAYRFQILSRAV